MKTGEFTDAPKGWNVSETVPGYGESWERAWTIYAPAPEADIFKENDEYIIKFKGVEIGRRSDAESAFQYAVLYLLGV